MTCSANDCTRDPVARGLCLMHWKRWRRHGDPNVTVKPPNGSVLAWLTDAVTVETDACVARAAWKGRPYVMWEGRYTPAAVAALVLAGHPRPPAPGNLACHHCDNPRCVNPRHLYWGTQSQNMKDMVARGRHWKHRTQLTNNPTERET